MIKPEGGFDMREIQAAQITETVRDLCIKANKVLPEALESCIRCGAGCRRCR